MMRGWLFIVAVLGAFAVLLCSIAPPASAYDSADSSRVTALADSSGDWSGGISPDHDPDAPPREYEPGEAGFPSDASESSQEAPEETTVDEDPGEAGLPSRPVFLYFSDYVTPQSEDPGEAGFPSDVSESSQEAPEETTVDEEPAEGGFPSDASESSQEVPEEPATPTDIKTFDDVYTVLVVLLGSLWALAGLFFAFKLGGAFL